MSPVSINKLSYHYGDQPVLQEINLSMHPGQVVAIMGASGSGKTTLLRLIGGQLYPDSGSVTVLGQSVPDLTHGQLVRLRRRIGTLFQFGALFTDLSVFDNVAFPIREHYHLPESMVRDLVLMKLQAVGLRGVSDRYPHELSGGMARRVALARAIALDPELILYDEPFTGLDPVSLGVTARLVRELNDALGATSVVVTHSIPETLAIANYGYFLAEGRVIAEGTPKEIMASKHPFVQQFVKGQPDGPVPFHVAAPDYAQDLGLTSRAAP